tara:strand:- start:913 stop:2379 length:1467 start_codon:yes stop_codon:yes gene_type:complete
MRIIYFVIGQITALFIIGCGAPTGTGLDSVSQSDSNKTLEIQEVLAVDDILINSNLKIGSGIQNGSLSGILNVGTLVTGTDGKISPFSVSLSSNTSIVFFEVSGGQNGLGGPSLNSSSRFFGVLELDSGNVNQIQPRININPFSSIVSYAKSQSPGRKVADLTLSAVSPFFTATATAGIDINSIQYSGQSSETIESNGDGILFQLMNEMIRVASGGQAGDSVVDKIANFCKQIEGQVSRGQDIFSAKGTVFQDLSNVSEILSTSPNSFGDFFGRAMSALSTSNASFKPASFAVEVHQSSNILIDSQVYLDSYSAEINNVSSGVAQITSSQGVGLILTSIPSTVRFDLSQNRFEAPAQGVLSIKVQRAIDDMIEATVNPVQIDSRSPFTMVFPQGALIQGLRQSPDGSILNVTTINQSADRFISSTGYMEIPLGELIAKGEAASGTIFPDSKGYNLLIEVRLRDIPEIRVQGFDDLIDTFTIPSLQISP